MKSQVLTLLLLTAGAFLFRSTHQSRLFKRELTEYDLTNFIVNTCSAEKTEAIIQNLCDQTMQSALMGSFPFLLYYCKTIGAERRFCGDLNRQTDTIQSDGAKRFAYRRFVRSLNNEDNRSNRGGQESGIESDLEQKMILQICLTNTEKRSSGTRRFAIKNCKKHSEDDIPKLHVFATLILHLPIADVFSLIHPRVLGHYQHHHHHFRRRCHFPPRLIASFRPCRRHLLPSSRSLIIVESTTTSKSSSIIIIMTNKSMCKRIFCLNHALNPQASSCERKNNKVQVQQTKS